jgi:hypothetical protein
MARPKEEIDLGFAKRFNQVIDETVGVPDKNHGRVEFLANKYRHKTDDHITDETMRKWITGKAFPSRKRMVGLAKTFGIDVAYLATGARGDATSRDRPKREIELQAAEELVSAAIKFDGGAVTYPDRTARPHVHIRSIIRGAEYNFHVSLAKKMEGGHFFTLPAEYSDSFVLGVVRTGAFNFDIIELPHEAIETGISNAARIDLVVTSRMGEYFVKTKTETIRLKKIETFAERP